MAKNKIKIQFFQQQIDNLLDFRQSIEEVSQYLRHVLLLKNASQQIAAIETCTLHFENQIKILKKDIQQTRVDSNLLFDQSQIEWNYIQASLHDKIDQLNERLFVAESGVQQAQIIKKQLDIVKPDYEMSNYKNFKKQSQVKTINAYIKAQKRIVNQLIRSINLLVKVSQRENNKTAHQIQNTELMKLLNKRQQKMSYIEMRRKQRQTSRRIKSEQKTALSAQLKDKISNLSKKKAPQPLLSLLMRSQSVPQKIYRQQAVAALLRKLKQCNKKQTISNTLFKNALQQENREKVRKYLESKNQLNQQESIMKLQLISSKFQEKYNERLLSIQLNSKQKSKQFTQGLSQQSEIILPQRPKSLQKQPESIQKVIVQKHSAQTHHTKKLQILSKQLQKSKTKNNKLASVSKTNDSSGIGII